ncbi:MAG: hypothetical protein ACLQOO_27850 [Terriglobia bacterium]
MINISSLDTAIAVVMVILILCLVVQAVQTALKKLLEIKSREVEDSLIDLFERIVPNVTRPNLKNAWMRVSAGSPMLRMLHLGAHPADPSQHPDSRVRTLFDTVTGYFKAVGGTSLTGRQFQESFPKGDLTKALGDAPCIALFPELTAKLQEACNIAAAIEASIESITAGVLAAATSASFIALRAEITPLVTDLGTLASGGTVRSDLLVHDLSNLRDVKWDDIAASLCDVQQKVEQDLAQASLARPTVDVAGLKTAVSTLQGIAVKLADVHARLDQALAPLRAKMEQAENAYETIRRSLQARYTRSMKTWATVISFLVVIVLNANFFTVYTNIATSDAKRSLILQSRDQIEQLYNQQANQASPGQSQNQTVQNWFQAARGQIDQNADIYAGFGFKPLGWSQVTWWWSTLTTGQGWWWWRVHHDLRVLVGWMLMAFVLSVGAPFWEDALESLLGIKNVLRNKSQSQSQAA